MGRLAAIRRALSGLLLGAALVAVAFAGCGGDDETSTESSETSSVGVVDVDDFKKCMSKGDFPLRSGADYFTEFEGYSFEASRLRDEASDVLVATNVEVTYKSRLPGLTDPRPQALVLLFDSPEHAATVTDDVPSDWIVRESGSVVWIFGGSSAIPVAPTKDTQEFSADASRCAEESSQA